LYFSPNTSIRDRDILTARERFREHTRSSSNLVPEAVRAVVEPYAEADRPQEQALHRK